MLLDVQLPSFDMFNSQMILLNQMKGISNIIIKHLSELSTWVFSYICVCMCATDFCLKWKMMMMMINCCVILPVYMFGHFCVGVSMLLFDMDHLSLCLSVCVCACVCNVVVLFCLVLFYGLLPDSNKDWLIDWLLLSWTAWFNISHHHHITWKIRKQASTLYPRNSD